MYIAIYATHNSNPGTVSEDDIHRKANLIESSCYDSAVNIATINHILCDICNGEFYDIYQNECAKILNVMNKLSKAYSADIMCKILADDDICAGIGKLPSISLNAARSQQELDIFNAQSAQVILEKKSNQYRCPICHKNETVISKQQTSAGDEDMTVKAQCTFCSYRWRV